ncbi:hypothetical protein MAPG_06223 [Magnaporthiopsis poae ATCC 64411]|uniref:Uncharacterized protein n=1 Tax=Magnaporthiopsis poae (strain ATCC 64411 / 73-15) TaxID=644358 RepID=A0A0C4E1G2_MAGP6|nr:hypothetical protein MAPG_06223 [Magnaporthiopsis poae ATCC 64411]
MPPKAASKKRRRSIDDDGDGPNTSARKIKKPRKTGGRAVTEAPIEHTITIETPPNFETLTWGIKQGVVVASVEVRLRFQTPRTRSSEQAVLDCFSIAFLPKKGEQQELWCNVREPWSEANTGAPLDNFLTYGISRKLHDKTARRQGRRRPLLNENFVKGVAGLIEGIVHSEPGRKCAVCDKAFDGGVKLWRPTPCSAACKDRMRKEFPLEVRVSPLLVDHLVLDFLLACAYSMIPRGWDDDMNPSRRGQDVATDAPNQWNFCWAPKVPKSLGHLGWSEMIKAVASFPAIDGSSTLATIVGTDGCRQEREAVLSWLSTEFQGCLVSASQRATVDYIRQGAPIKPLHQFIILNSTLKREMASKQNKEHKIPGVSVFHATPAYNILQLVMEDLRIIDNGRGAIFFAGSFATSSCGYQRGYIFRPWPNSVFASVEGCHELVFGAEFRGELASKSLEYINTWSDQSWSEWYTASELAIILRYVFLSLRSFCDSDTGFRRFGPYQNGIRNQRPQPSFISISGNEDGYSEQVLLWENLVLELRWKAF